MKPSIKKSLKKCTSGYFRNPSTKKCVYKTGTIGRKISQKRSISKSKSKSKSRSKTRSKFHQRDGRPSPNISATLFSTGRKLIGHDKNMWIVKKTSKGIKRWVRT